MDDPASKRAAFAASAASVALFVFATLTLFAVFFWFRRTPAPWTWKGLLAGGCAALALATSALMWSTPSREYAMLGAIIMLASLVRVGLPGDWSWTTLTVLAVTVVLSMPVVHAAIVLKDG